MSKSALILTVSLILSGLIYSDAHAQIARISEYTAKRLQTPGSSSQVTAVAFDGSYAGVAYFPDAKIFWQKGTKTGLIESPLLSGNCVPQAVNGAGAKVLVAGICTAQGDGAKTPWYWNGSAVTILQGSSSLLEVNGLSASGIVSGNAWQSAANFAVAWNGATGAQLDLYASLAGGQYASGISNTGLVGLSGPIATLDLNGNIYKLLLTYGSPPSPDPQQSLLWGDESIAGTMGQDGSQAGSLSSVSLQPPMNSWRSIVVWKNGSIVRQITGNPCPAVGSRVEWVSALPGNRVLVSCFTYSNMTGSKTIRVSPAKGNSASDFRDLAQVTRGLPAGPLRVLRNATHTGAMVAHVEAPQESGAWLISPSKIAAEAASTDDWTATKSSSSVE